MRIFLTILLLLFHFQPDTKADDIHEFEIEGMSVGESLLDFFSKNEIEENYNKIAGKKIGRNEPCICGSGKKYKHCCGAL